MDEETTGIQVISSALSCEQQLCVIGGGRCAVRGGEVSCG